MQCGTGGARGGHVGRDGPEFAGRPLFKPLTSPHISSMNYILAILLPPLSILLTGRPILGIVVFFIWIPALLLSGGLTHPMFILLAWFLIFTSRERAAARTD